MKKRLISLIVIIVVIILAGGIIMPFMQAHKITLNQGLTQQLTQDANIHFDNPLQRLTVFHYQIIEQRTDGYVIVGRTIFGIPAVKALITNAGSIITL